MSEDYLDRGDNAWQLTAATFVGLQSIPGLMILYGGIVKKKWAVNSAFMVLYAFSAVLICWVGWGYKFAFGNQWFPLWGKPGPAVGASYYMSQAYLPAANITAAYPQATQIYFQFVFAAITLILIAGALLGRMNFLAWMLFVPLWFTFSYTIGAFSVWGGGFLFKWGVLDWAGGYVGPRLARDRERFPPNNILLVLAGAGMLWLGWNGFNGGAPYAANAVRCLFPLLSPGHQCFEFRTHTSSTKSSRNAAGADTRSTTPLTPQIAAVAVLNTNIACAFSILTWTACDIFYFGKPSVIGAVQGLITGLVVITPGAGAYS
eukprot:SM002098S06358  [mRNA]  locus=s2098:332:1730:- [translate_table: standard]